MLTRGEVALIAEEAADKAVAKTLLTFGIDADNPIRAQSDFAVLREVGRLAMNAEFRKDLEHARKWRLEMEAEDGAARVLADAKRRMLAAEQIRAKSLLTLVGIVVAAAAGALWLGLQDLLARGH